MANFPIFKRKNRFIFTWNYEGKTGTYDNLRILQRPENGRFECSTQDIDWNNAKPDPNLTVLGDWFHDAEKNPELTKWGTGHLVEIRDQEIEREWTFTKIRPKSIDFVDLSHCIEDTIIEVVWEYHDVPEGGSSTAQGGGT